MSRLPSSSSDRAAAPPTFKDGLGSRVRAADQGGDAVEHLQLAQEIAAQESALRDRVGRLINFRHARYVRLRGVDRAKTGNKPLVVAYDALDGHRLSSVLETLPKVSLSLEVDVALQIVRDLLPAIGILHDSRKVTHGCIAPERLVYTSQQRLVIVDHGLGAALQRMNVPRKKLWDQYRIASPAPNKALFDEKMDVVQIGLVALALLLGRPLADDEYPGQVKRLILSVKESSSRIGSRPIGPELRRWLERATGVDEAQTFASIKEAQDAFETVVAVDRYGPTAGAVKTFFTRYEEVAARLRPAAADDDDVPAKTVPGAKVDVDSALAGLDMQVTITPTRRRPTEPLPEAIELKPPSKAKASKAEAPAEPAKAEAAEPVKFGRRKTDRLDAMQALQDEMNEAATGDVSALEQTANAVYKDAERRGRGPADEQERAAREAAERGRHEAEAREKTEREGRALAEKVARDAAEQAARESADRVAAERQAQAAAEREAAERGARQEAERLAHDASLRATREAAEREAAERAARDASAREEAEREARRRLERDHKEAAEERAREAAARDAREAAERQAREQAEREARAAAERAAREAAERAAAERAALEAALRAEREASERAAAERAAQEAAHRAEREAAERVAAQRAAQEAAERAEREAAERAAAQRAAQEAAERAEREAAERAAAQRAAREAAEREAAHRAAREAAEQAAREAAERAVLEAAEREAAHRAALEAAEQAVREAAERAAAERAAREAAEQAAREASERALADFAAQRAGFGEAEIASRVAAEREAYARQHAEATESERSARALAEREAREMSERAKREAAERAAAERAAREAAARAEAEREARAAAEREAQRAAERAAREAAERHAAERAAREAAALMEAERQARTAAEARANEASEHAAREVASREAAERAAREAAQTDGGRRRRKKRIGQRSPDEVVAVQPLPSMADVPDGPNFSTQPAPVEAPQAPMMQWQPGQSVEVMPAWARGGAGVGPAEPVAPEPPESSTITDIYAPAPPSAHAEPSHASILPFKPQDDSWMRRAPQAHEPAADPESRAIAPGPTTAPRKRFRINWARTLAASLLVALLEGVAFATAWWYVTPEQQGWLVVHTKPAGIQVSVDGLVVGQTPIAKALPPGRHTIELRYGTATRVVPVEISAGVQTEQRLAWGNGFTTGQASITSTPAGSKVAIDGRHMGKTPLTVSDLLPGKHEVTVEGETGSVSAMLMVEAGETTELDVPVYAGWVSVLSPVQLDILLDGKLIGSTEIEKLMLKPGRHKLDLENESLGYRGSVEVRVRPGATTSVSVVPKTPVTVEAPAGTELAINGENMGTLPNAALEVPLGTAEFVMRYKDEERRHVVPVTMSTPVVVKYDQATVVEKR
jgi:PEGA domain-containing protein